MKKSKKTQKNKLPKNKVKLVSGQMIVRMKTTLNKLWTFVKTTKGKIITSILIVIIAICIILAIPFTRYGSLSWLIKRDIQITVLDSFNSKPVSDALVSLGDVSARTDSEGHVVLSTVKIGEYDLKISKKYYTEFSESYTVPLFTQPSESQKTIVATGRQIDVTVKNKITGALLDGAVVSADDTSASTNSSGVATIVLPADKTVQTGTISRPGYNTINVELAIYPTEPTDNNFSITEAGSILYISKATGKLDVMKTDLDGSNPTVLLAGTGQENDYDTQLVPSKDWQYAVLKSLREGDKAKLGLIDAAKGTYTVIDEGDASFVLHGWSGHNFFYLVYRNTANYWDNQRTALKSYNADTHKLTTIDQTVGSGSYWTALYQSINSLNIVDNELVYIKTWTFGTAYKINEVPSDKTLSIIAVDTKTNKMRTIKEIDQNYYLSTYNDSYLYSPSKLLIRISGIGADTSMHYYSYDNKKIQEDTELGKKSSNTHPAYIMSPSGNRSFWSEVRDGKNTLFIADKAGSNEKEIASLSEYVAYGWYGDSDQYILLSKDNSELYIAASDRTIGQDGIMPVKVANYHKFYF